MSLADAALAGACAALDGGTLQLWSGSLLLATLQLGIPAFHPPEDGEALLRPVSGTASGTGRLNRFRLLSQFGEVQREGGIGKGAELQADAEAVEAGAEITLRMTLRQAS